MIGRRAKVSDHGSHLIQIARPLANCYLVREEDGLTLVDCSTGGSTGLILAAAEAADPPIRRIALTHAHWDHVGSLDALSDALPQVDLLVGEREARILAGDFSLDAGEPAGKLRRFVYRRSDRVPDRLLHPGDMVGSLEVVAAPGHTPGQIAFLDTRDRTLLCGDAYLAVGKPFVTNEFVLRFPFPALVGTWHAPTAMATAEALHDLDPSRLATGHGPVIEQPAKAMGEALPRVRDRQSG